MKKSFSSYQFPFMRVASAYLTLTTALFLFSSTAAHAASVAFEAANRAGSNACARSLQCVSNNTAIPSPYLLAEQTANDTVSTEEGFDKPTNINVSRVGYPTMLWEDTKHVLSAPARWDDQEWRDMGWATLGVLGVMAVIDRPVQDLMRRIAPDNDPLTPNDNRFLHEMERFGREYSLGLLGGFYIVGALSDNETAVAVAQDGLTSVIIASGIITTAAKVTFGRARPRDDLGTAEFNPFGGDHSFPSGHTSHAFAVASVIANHYDETWITYSSYAVAGLVGVARSYHGGHFASDILAGGMIGTMVGKSVVEYNKPMRAGKIVLIPEVTPGMTGLRMVSRF